MGGTGRCVPRGHRTTRGLRHSPNALACSQPDRTRGVGPGRRFACTRCRANRPTLRNRTFGSLAELGARHRVDMHRKGGRHRQRWVAPATVGGTGNSGWHRQRWHRQRWVAPETVVSKDSFRVINEPRGQSANRRRHQPALSRTGKGGWHRQAIRLHPVSGDPPDHQKPHIRLAGRIGYQPPSSHATVGGTGQGGWHRQRWGVAPADAFHVVNEPRGQSANRRRHQPALSRTGRTGPHLTPSNSPLMSSGRNSSPPAQGFPGSDYTFSSRPHQQSE